MNGRGIGNPQIHSCAVYFPAVISDPEPTPAGSWLSNQRNVCQGNENQTIPLTIIALIKHRPRNSVNQHQHRRVPVGDEVTRL